ncbi:MAG: flagellar export chaperone FliS [Succinivibrionaceae bacterium]
MYGRNLKAYKTTNLEAEISVADPHRIISMLYAGLFERIAQAKGAIERKDYAYKADRIEKAIAIVTGLQTGIDMNQGQIAENFNNLYIYVKQRLNDAAINLDTAALDEVIKLLLPIKQAWDKIPESEKQKAYAQRKALDEQEMNRK